LFDPLLVLAPGVRLAAAHINRSNWGTELLALYGEYLLSTPSSAIEHQIYARTYHCLLTHYPMELAPFFTKFYAFFKKYFSEHMEDNKPSGEPPAPSAPQSSSLLI
jgi:hypothetical protein